MRLRNSKVKVLGLLALPKNSYQNAGSKENEAYDGVWPIDAPDVEEGTFSWMAFGLSALGIPSADVLLNIKDTAQATTVLPFTLWAFIFVSGKKAQQWC